jgi:glycosyltransferase involved in cell wall biosynthesis
MNIKISVIIPVYNCETYLYKCIDSVLTQSLSDFELILINDGSNDRSGEILEQYKSRDNRIIVVHKENGGVSEARNFGINRSSGAYLYIMDSDDYLETDALEAMYSHAINTNSDVVIADHYTFKDVNLPKSHHFFNKEFLTDEKEIIDRIQAMVLHSSYSPYFSNENTGLGLGAPWTKLVKRKLVTENRIQFDSALCGIFDDGLFSLYVFEYAQRVSYIRKLIYRYRILPDSLIHRYNPNRIKINYIIFEKINEFSKIFSKNIVFTQAYHSRVSQYFFRLLAVHFFNSNHPKKFRESYKEINSVLNSKPYNIALNKVDFLRIRFPYKLFVIFKFCKLTIIYLSIYSIVVKLKHKLIKYRR